MQDRRPGFFEALVSWAAYAPPSAPSLNAAAAQLTRLATQMKAEEFLKLNFLIF